MRLLNQLCQRDHKLNTERRRVETHSTSYFSCWFRCLSSFFLKWKSRKNPTLRPIKVKIKCASVSVMLGNLLFVASLFKNTI
jgi:hypothetical protein